MRVGGLEWAMTAEPEHSDDEANAPESGNLPEPATPPPHRHRGPIRRYFDWLLVCVGVNPGYRPWEPDSEPPPRQTRK